MPTVPDPQYDRDVAILIRYYKRAVLAISSELARLDVSEMSRANAKLALAEVAKILRSLDADSAAWAERYIPAAAVDGVVRAMVELGVADTVEDAQKVAKFTRINREYVAAAVADTQADLLAVTQNIDRRVRQAVRQAAGESMRANLTKGVNGQRTIQRDILAQMRKTLGSAVETGIIDAAGRRWKPEVYVEMAARTKMNVTHREATVNEAVGRGVYYARISRHGAIDACGPWEGRIVKLVREADGEYPFVGDISRRELFHPYCRHTLNPIRDPRLLAQ